MALRFYGKTITGMVAVLALAMAAPAHASASPALAPLGDGGKEALPGRYIVMLKQDAAAAQATAQAQTRAQAHGGKVLARYSHVLQGFAAELPARALAAVQADPGVARVEPDTAVEAATDQVSPPSWGLDRIDQRLRPLNNVYTYDSAGAGVTVFVIDSGIRETHVDFGGRAQGAYDAVGDGHGTEDCTGHGTHVAATIGGETFGVAKGVQIRAVRMFDCTGFGTSADLIEAMDWVAANHPARSVVNLSIRTTNPAAGVAADALIDSGVHTVISAGNEAADSCVFQRLYSPRAVMVGATDISDSIASFSNTGACVDVFAPGVDIVSASHLSDTGSVAKNGTSMAAPHAAGWIARHLSENPSATTAQSKAALVDTSSKGLLSLGPTTPNRLLWADPANTPPDTTPPSAPASMTLDFVSPFDGVLVSWPASTDDTGVAAYNVYQVAGPADLLLATIRGTSATLEHLWDSTRNFYVRAVDVSGNLSAASPAVTVTIGPAPCRVSYDASGGGPTFTANLVITNTSTTPINGWGLEFSFPSIFQNIILEQTWGANWSQIGTTVFATNMPWNATINPSSSVFLGFNGTFSGTNPEPATFRLNGIICSIG
ncbi:MAG TPA: S8 family serine peptidase [Candidatus Limnocylindrales bacterium]